MKVFQQLWFRYAVTASLFVVLLWLVFSILTYALFHSSLQESLDASLTLSTGQAIAAVNIEDEQINLSDSVPDLSALGTVLEGGFLVQIHDLSGKLVLKSGSMAISDVSEPRVVDEQSFFSSSLGTPPDRQFRALSAPIRIGDKIVGSIQVYRGTLPVQNALNRLMGIILAVLPVFIIITFLGSSIIAQRSLAPINQMVQQASRISETNLSQRLTSSRRDDELGRLAKVFNGLLSRLERAFEVEKRFTADAAHELRTPLNAIRMIVDTTSNRLRTASEYQKALRDLGKQAERLGRLTNDLLFLAREPTRLVRDQFDLTLMVDDVVASLEPLAHAKGISMTAQEFDPLLVLGDRDAIARALFNIIDNAIRYTEHGGVLIRFSGGKGKPSLVEVVDTGIGITAEHLPHIFERFYRCSADRSEGSSGLGLSIASEIVSAHNGTIEVASRLGHGSTFRVILPVS